MGCCVRWVRCRVPMMTSEQEEFDAAFNSLVAEDALDDVIEKLAAVGVTILPSQRGVLWACIAEFPDEWPTSTKLAMLKSRLAGGL